MKVGDIVRIRGDFYITINGERKNLYGTFCEVVEVRGDEFLVRDEVRGIRIPVKEHEVCVVKRKSEIKVGDTVRVIREKAYENKLGKSYDLEGFVGTVMELYPKTNTCNVKIVGVRNTSNTHGYFCIKNEDIQLAFSGYSVDTISISGRLKLPKAKPPKYGTPLIKTVSFNKKKGVTYVVFSDGDVVHATVQKGDKFDKRTGVLNCIAKKYFGKKSAYNDILALCVEKGDDHK